MTPLLGTRLERRRYMAAIDFRRLMFLRPATDGRTELEKFIAAAYGSPKEHAPESELVRVLRAYQDTQKKRSAK